MADANEPKKTPDEKPAAAAKATDKATDKASDTSNDKADGKAPAAKTAEKAVDKPAAKPADKKSDKPTDKTADKPADAAKPAAKSGSVPPSGTATDAPVPAPKSGGGGRAFIVLAILVAIVAGGGYATRNVWSPMVKPYFQKFVPEPGAAEKAPVEAAKTSMTVEERLAALEQKSTADGAGEMQELKDEAARAKADLGKALQRIDDLERRLVELREVASALTSSSASGNADLSGVMTRIDGLEAGRRQDEAEIAALTRKLSAVAAKGSGSAGSGTVLALAQLRDAVLAGRPYGAQLDALMRVAGDNADVSAGTARLKDHAATGLATPEALSARFTKVAAEVLTKTRAASDNWVDQTTAKLAGLVSLRRTDGMSGDTVEDSIAAIEKKLAGRELSAAADVAGPLADALPKPAQEVFEPWLLDLKARVTAERALDAMQASALAALDRK